MNRPSSPPDIRFLTTNWQYQRNHITANIVRGIKRDGQAPGNPIVIPKKLIKYNTW